jgi:histidyl-tRNA synthetase
MKSEFAKPRGMLDLLPDFLEKWSYVETTWRSLARAFSYREIRTPILEHTELFVRGAGDTSDIVAKEMYTFLDKGGRSLSLRPEGTAPVVRAYMENQSEFWPPPVKLFYVAPMFRYERPQAGRYRQHTQYGVEVIGSTAPFVDIEVIALVTSFYRELGFDQLKVNLNSVGDGASRARYQQILAHHLREHADKLCNDCRLRTEANPLRALDCKQPGCQPILDRAPRIIDHLSEESRIHFEDVRRGLEDLGISYVLNPRLVRGLDYYSRTAFEVISEKLGAQDALAGGGRYDGLFESLGGKPTPAMGFGAGIERLIYAMEKHGLAFPARATLEVFVASIGERNRKAAEEVLWTLRESKISAEIDHEPGRPLKRQLSRAERLGAHFAVIIGEDELQRAQVQLRDLRSGDQTGVTSSDLVSHLWKQLRGDKCS